MKWFRTTHDIAHDPGRALRLRSRPGILMGVTFVLLALGAVISLVPLQWSGLFLSICLALPAFWTGALVWMDWGDAHIPRRGAAISWRDGLRKSSLPANRILALNMEMQVQPALHKGPGPTAFLTLWACDAALKNARGSDSWRRIFTMSMLGRTTDQIETTLATIRKALTDLGYSDAPAR